MFEKILVALDGSEHTAKALQAAADLAKLSGAEVVVLHVREGYFVGRAGEVPIEDHAEASKIVDDAVEQLTAAGVKATATVRGCQHGRVAREILGEADSSRATIIVMGSRGVNDLEGLLIGSTTHKVLHLGKLPVLVVP